MCACALCRFLFRNNGILYENELVQVGLKSEFRNNLGLTALSCFICSLVRRGLVALC